MAYINDKLNSENTMNTSLALTTEEIGKNKVMFKTSVFFWRMYKPNDECCPQGNETKIFSQYLLIDQVTLSSFMVLWFIPLTLFLSDQ